MDCKEQAFDSFGVGQCSSLSDRLTEQKHSTKIAREGLACRRMQWGVSFVLAEASIAWGLAKEEERK